MATLVIVSGPPCSGKTTLARYLAEALGLPMFSKDDFKEQMFDVLSGKDRAWSRLLGATSLRLLYHIAGEELRRGKSLIIEANFKPSFDTEQVGRMQTEHQCSVVEVHCFAPAEVLFERFKQRSGSDSRHPGHGDAHNLEEARQKFFNSNVHGPLGVGEVMPVDTSDFALVNFAALTRDLERFLAR